MKNNRFIKIIILNLIIIITAVSAYSPGLLALYPSDESIFRAGLSILIGIFLIVLFFYGNFSILSDKKPKIEVQDLTQAKKILNLYKNSRYFGEMTKTVLSQLERLGRSMTRLQYEIDRKFDKHSLSNDKYSAIINEANKSLTDNIISVTHKIDFFDEKEYTRLLNYKKDNIPDDIQLKQLELYQTNQNSIQHVIDMNERLILQLDTLAVELSRPGGQGDGVNDDIINEIQQLTKEVQYYQ